MKKGLYEVVFKVTETCQNGCERTFKKSVYIPRFDENTIKHITEEQRIQRGIKALEEERFYNIQYITTHSTFLTFG